MALPGHQDAVRGRQDDAKMAPGGAKMALPGAPRWRLGRQDDAKMASGGAKMAPRGRQDGR